MLTSLFLSLKVVLRKQRNVRAARTVRLNANTALRRDNAVFIIFLFFFCGLYLEIGAKKKEKVIVISSPAPLLLAALHVHSKLTNLFGLSPSGLLSHYCNVAPTTLRRTFRELSHSVAMDPNPPQIVVLPNATDEAWPAEKLVSEIGTLRPPDMIKPRRAPSVFVSQNPVHKSPDSSSHFPTNLSDLPEIPAIYIDGSTAEPAARASVTSPSIEPPTSNTFSRLVTTIHFLKKWAGRAEKSSDTKNDFLKKFKMSDSGMVETPKDTDEKKNNVQVRIRRKLWRKNYFFNPTGSVLYW